MKRFIPLLSLLAVLFFPMHTIQASGSERITSLDSVASLSTENILTVKETITVDFGSTSHHGIYRFIPTIQRSDKDTYYYEFDLIGVSSSTGASANIASQTKDGDNEVIQIGDSSRTISGIHSYTISYRLSPLALSATDSDRVNINVTGQGWEYPIDKASMHLVLPTAPISKAVCYTGTVGSTMSNCTVTQSSNVIDVASTASLPAGYGMTIDMSLPSDSFTNYLVANQKPPLSTSTYIRIILIGVAWIFGLYVLLAFLYRSISNKRLRKDQTVVAQYEAPDNLTPGQIGLLIDSKSDMKEFASTLIDMAVRGYLKITRLESTQLGFIKKTDYQFDLLRPNDGLRDFELLIYTMLFASGSAMKMSELTTPSRSTTNQKTITEIRKTLATNLKDAGLYGVDSDLVNLNVWVISLVGIMFAAGVIFPPVILAIMLYSTGMGMILYAFLQLKKYPRLTPVGVAEWAKVEGFKLYLSVAEKDRINFTDAPERTPERFNKLLPYAVALGVEKEWAKQFEGIDVTPPNGWYAGSGVMAFNSADFTSSFASSFSSSMNSGFSGSSGGGGAGSGGGGGGGGGW